LPEERNDAYLPEDELPPDAPCGQVAADPPLIESLPAASADYRIEMRRGDLINKILEAYENYYEEKNGRNHTYKRVFFYAILSMLGVIILAFAAAGIIIAVRGASWKDALPLLGGGTAALLTSLIILPQIIATHLFPVKEDQVIVDLIAVLRGINPYGAPRGDSRGERSGRG